MSDKLMNAGVIREWRGRVVYHVLLDRFAGVRVGARWDVPVFAGGSIRVVVDRLPYLRELGVNAILVSPFYRGVSYHGYHVTDFYGVDGRFGTEGDLRELLEAAHGMGMKVLADFVPNHVSCEHPYFLEALDGRTSRYRDWFFIREGEDYVKFLTFPELVKLNLDNAGAMEHVRGAMRKWLGLGFDGMRLDHVIGLSNGNVRDLLAPLREEFPDRVFVGEACMSDRNRFGEMRTVRVPYKYVYWLVRKFTVRANNILMRNYVGLLDGVLDFVLPEYLYRYAMAGGARRAAWEKKIRRQERRLGEGMLQFVFLDNHDAERFLFRVGGDVGRLRAAAKLQFSLSQPVMIYYGTEVGMTQEEGFESRESYADVLAREPMIWDKRKQNDEILGFYKEFAVAKMKGAGKSEKGS